MLTKYWLSMLALIKMKIASVFSVKVFSSIRQISFSTFNPKIIFSFKKILISTCQTLQLKDF